MTVDPDAIWKPGYPSPHRSEEAAAPPRVERLDGARAPPNVPTSRVIPTEAVGARTPVPGPGTHETLDLVNGDGWLIQSRENESANNGPHRHRRTIGFAAITIAGLLMGGFVVVSVMSDDPGPDRPDTGELAGVDTRTMPSEVEQLWSTRLAGSGNAVAPSVFVHDRELVVAVVDDGSRNRSMIAGVDAMSGELRWRRSLSFAPAEVSPLAVIDDTVIIEQNDHLSSNRLIGLATSDGTTRWERRLPERSFNVVLGGSRLVANISTDGARTTTFYEPLSGEPAGEVAGQLPTADLDGTWYFTPGGDLVSVDLSTGWTDPVMVGEIGPTVGPSMAVVDGRVLVPDAFGRLNRLGASGELQPIGRGTLPAIEAIWPAGGSSLVAVGEGEIFGVELDGDSARLTWRRESALLQFALTERGLALAVSDHRSGLPDDELVLIDGVTGTELVATTREGGPTDTLIIGNGFIAAAAAPRGTTWVGHDLDGKEVWQLTSHGKIAVGEELVVELANGPSGFVLTAYGNLG